jgi:signal transduction histidine kinase
LTVTFIGLAVVPLLLVGAIQQRQSTAVHSQEAIVLQREIAQRAAVQVDAFLHELESELHITVQVEDLLDLDHDRQQIVLSKLQSYKDVFAEIALMNHRGQELTRVSRRARVAAADLGDRSQADEFLVAAFSDRTYTSPVWFDEEIGEPLMTIAVRITDARSGAASGVLTADVRLKAIWDLVAGIRVGETGNAYILGQSGQVIAHRNPSVVLRGTTFDLPERDGIQTGLSGTRVVLARTAVSFGEGMFTVVTERPVAEALAPAINQRNILLGIGVAGAVIVAVLGVFFARTITRPVEQLVKGAEEIGRGNLEHRVEVESRDELGRLAHRFNRMVADLQVSMGETAHGQRLLWALSQAAHSVQRARSTEAVYRTVGDEVADLGYHAIIFQVTDDRTSLSLVYLSIESSLLRAAERLAGVSAREYRRQVVPGDIYDRVLGEQQTLYVKDMSERLARALPRLARPLAGRIVDMVGFPRAVYAPLVIGDETYGLLVIAGKSLTEDDVPAVTAFANQAAIAIQNARLYQEVRQHAERLEARVAERTQELDDARIAALNMMEDADEARKETERVNEELIREIERRKRVEAEWARSNKELEQFAYIASHDLQEPLRKVQAFGDRLEARFGEALGERGRDYVARMQDAARRGQVMVNDLLAFSRVTTRGQPFAPVDLLQIADEALSDLEIRIERSGGQVEIGPSVGQCGELVEPSGQPALPTIDADHTQMRQLLENLIGNALKYHREGVAPVVKVYGQEIAGQDAYRICVEDNGIGFDVKYLDRLFQPFQRLHGRGQYEGTGIGLAICRKIAERHGGSITARSTPGEGSTFVVTLPRRQPKGARDGQD